MTTDEALRRLEPLLKLKGEKLHGVNIWDGTGGIHIALITRTGSLSEGTLRYLKMVLPVESVLSSYVTWVPDDQVKKDPMIDPGPSISALFGESPPGDYDVPDTETEEPNPYMASEDDLTDFLKLSDRDQSRVLFRAIANVNQTIEGMGNQIGPPTTRNLDQRLNELREIVHELMKVKASKVQIDALADSIMQKAPMGNVTMLEKVSGAIREDLMTVKEMLENLRGRVEKLEGSS